MEARHFLALDRDRLDQHDHADQELKTAEPGRKVSRAHPQRRAVLVMRRSVDPYERAERYEDERGPHVLRTFDLHLPSPLVRARPDLPREHTVVTMVLRRRSVT